MASLAAPLVFPLGGGLFVATESDVWAQDMLEVDFAEPMKNDELLQSATAFSVVPLDGGNPVDVVGVLTGNSVNPTQIFLNVTPPSVGKTYRIDFQNLYAITGAVLSPNSCKFIGRDTKEDIIINSRPQMYDMSPGSRLRWLMQSIGRQDDLIGGSRKDRFLKF